MGKFIQAILGFVAIAMASYLSFEIPFWLKSHAPLSLPLTLFFFAGWASFAAYLVLPITFALQYLWLADRPYFLKYTAVLFAITSVLSILFLLVNLQYGIRWQGVYYTAIACIQALVLIFVVGLLLRKAQKKSSSAVLRVANVLIFLSWAWGAFPYLGELP